jgi:hypothetical protein
MARINDLVKTVLRLALVLTGAGFFLLLLTGLRSTAWGFWPGAAIVILSFHWSAGKIRQFMMAVSAVPEEGGKVLNKFRLFLFLRLGSVMSLMALALALGADLPGFILGMSVIPGALMATALICLAGYIRFGEVEVGSC